MLSLQKRERKTFVSRVHMYLKKLNRCKMECERKYKQASCMGGFPKQLFKKLVDDYTFVDSESNTMSVLDDNGDNYDAECSACSLRSKSSDLLKDGELKFNESHQVKASKIDGKNQIYSKAEIDAKQRNRQQQVESDELDRVTSDDESDDGFIGFLVKNSVGRPRLAGGSENKLSLKKKFRKKTNSCSKEVKQMQMAKQFHSSNVCSLHLLDKIHWNYRQIQLTNPLPLCTTADQWY